MIPQVRQAENSEETNKILNEWLLSLGEIKYKTDETTALWSSAKEEDKVVIADTSGFLIKNILARNFQQIWNR